MPSNNTTIHDGLLYNGIIIPCRAPVKTYADHGMCFTPNTGGVRKRSSTSKPNLIVTHWTAGEGDASQVFSTLKKRITPKSPKGLSVHLFIDYFGSIFQYCDLNLATLHASAVNDRSIGIEIQSRGLDVQNSSWRAKFPRTAYVDTLKRVKKTFVRFTTAQLDSLHSVVDALTDPQYGLGIPRNIPGWAENGDHHLLLKDNLPIELNQTFEGVIGHYHVSTKYDPGPEPLEYLIRHGYAPVAVSTV